MNGLLRLASRYVAGAGCDLDYQHIQSQRARGLHMCCTHGWNHTAHITALRTAPEQLILYSRAPVRPTWLATTRLASRSVDSKKSWEGSLVIRIDAQWVYQGCTFFAAHLLAGTLTLEGSDGVARQPVKLAEDESRSRESEPVESHRPQHNLQGS